MVLRCVSASLNGDEDVTLEPIGLHTGVSDRWTSSEQRAAEVIVSISILRLVWLEDGHEKVQCMLWAVHVTKQSTMCVYDELEVVKLKGADAPAGALV